MSITRGSIGRVKIQISRFFVGGRTMVSGAEVFFYGSGVEVCDLGDFFEGVVSCVEGSAVILQELMGGRERGVGGGR